MEDIELTNESLEVVDQQEETEPIETEVEGEEDVELADPQTEDSKYAAARRKAEAETERIRKEYEDKEQGLNTRVQSMFKGLKNPETGEEIKTVEDYFDALDAQNRIKTRKQIEDAGVDPDLIDKAISSNKEVIEARRILQRTQQNEGQRIINEQIQKIGKIDPSIKTLEDIYKKDRFEEWDAMVRTGVSLENAYKAVYFDELTSGKTAAARQAAINSAKGKSHLEPTGGSAQPSGNIEVPRDVMRTLREMFPDDSADKLRERYIKTLR